MKKNPFSLQVNLDDFLPATAEEISKRLGGAKMDWDSLNVYGVLPSDVATVAGPALFPRIDIKKELEVLSPAADKADKKEEKQQKKEEKKADKQEKKQEKKHEEPEYPAEINIDTFFQSKIQVGRVLECTNVPKSKKLLQFRLSFGKDGERTILSGIHEFYEPEELLGKTLVAIINLPPRKMMGLESCGMLISAVHTEKGEEKLNLLMVSDAIPAGAKLC